MVGERRPEVLAIVVVAGDDEERNGKRQKDFPDVVVLGRLAVVDQISGDQHQIRAAVQGEHVLDRRREAGVGVHHPVVELALGPDMGIRQLRNQHAAASTPFMGTTFTRRRPGGSATAVR